MSKIYKKKHKKLVVVTAYDTPTAELVDAAGVDIVLVGDSLGMVVLGYDSTTRVTMDEMIHHTKAVRRGVRHAKLVADLPLKGISRGPAQALRSSRRFIREAGCDAVKLEWGKSTPSILKMLASHKIPVMGHVGLTPQSARGEFRVQGRDAASAGEILRQAEVFERLGAFSIVLECIPRELGALITHRLKIPTIGIGAGNACGGQVLVFHDLVGLFTRFLPKHVKRYAEGARLFASALSRYSSQVRRGQFPDKNHSFGMDRTAFADFRQSLQGKKGV